MVVADVVDEGFDLAREKMCLSAGLGLFDGFRFLALVDGGEWKSSSGCASPCPMSTRMSSVGTPVLSPVLSLVNVAGVGAALQLHAVVISVSSGEARGMVGFPALCDL